MLINSGVRFGGGPMRTMGGAQAGNIERARWGQPGSIRSFYTGEATVVSGASIADKSGFPSGYLDPYSWVLPQKSGGLASMGRAVGSGGIASGNLAGGRNIDSDLVGSGTITNAALGLILSAVAALSGSGSVSSAAIVGRLGAAAALAGAGTVSAAALTALAALVSAVAGAGTATGTFGANGALSADITVTGDLLTTSNVASAIWGAVAEGSFTYERLLRIIAAATAGESTGGPGSPVFRNVADTQNQISGTANANGDRSAITYGA